MTREIRLIPKDMELPDRPPLCDVCGEAATTIARDFQEMEPVMGDDGMWAMWQPVGEWRFGCDEHPVRGEMVRLDGEVHYVEREVVGERRGEK